MAQVTPFDDAIMSFMKMHGAEQVGVFGSYAREEARPDEAFRAHHMAQDAISAVPLLPGRQRRS